MRRHGTAPHASQALMGEGGLAVICKTGPKLRLYQDTSRDRTYTFEIRPSMRRTCSGKVTSMWSAWRRQASSRCVSCRRALSVPCASMNRERGRREKRPSSPPSVHY